MVLPSHGSCAMYLHLHPNSLDQNPQLLEVKLTKTGPHPSCAINRTKKETRKWHRTASQFLVSGSSRSTELKRGSTALHRFSRFGSTSPFPPTFWNTEPWSTPSTEVRPSTEPLAGVHSHRGLAIHPLVGVPKVGDAGLAGIPGIFPEPPQAGRTDHREDHGGRVGLG